MDMDTLFNLKSLALPPDSTGRDSCSLLNPEDVPARTRRPDPTLLQAMSPSLSRRPSSLAASKPVICSGPIRQRFGVIGSTRGEARLPWETKDQSRQGLSRNQASSIRGAAHTTSFNKFP
jgi:hypothetical protein